MKLEDSVQLTKSKPASSASQKKKPSMDSVKCKVCQKEFASVKSLHGHLKAHQLRQAQYYQKYCAKYDKFTGEIIKFKNMRQVKSSFVA